MFSFLPLQSSHNCETVDAAEGDLDAEEEEEKRVYTTLHSDSAQVIHWHPLLKLSTHYRIYCDSQPFPPLNSFMFTFVS